MAEKKDDFFDEEDEDDTKAPDATAKKAQADTVEPKPAETKPEGEEKIDWKAKYEAAEAERLDQRYLDELLLLDDTLEGDSLEAIEGGKRYRELRTNGLSARAAFAALREEIAEASSEHKNPTASGKNHVSATTFRATSPRSKMDRETRAMMQDIFPDKTEEELENLYRRVNGN